jgi:hypothetical protein
VKKETWRRAFIVVAWALVGAAPVGATYVRQMNLRSLYENADRVFRGTVVESTRGTVEAGGGRIPVIHYRLRVHESFQGSTRPGSEVEIRMLDPKAGAGRASGSARAVSPFEGLPQLTVGEEYLLFVTRPSAVGLSTTVGLGQGCFHVRTGRQKSVVNERNNMGLFHDMPTALAPSGPLSYSELAGEIRRLIRSR